MRVNACVCVYVCDNKTNNSRQTFMSKKDHDLHRIKGNFSFVDFLTFNLSKFYVVRENFLTRIHSLGCKISNDI